jgi:hypothetical protein
MARASASRRLALAALLAAAMPLAEAAEVPRGTPLAHDVRRGPGVASVRWLSDWLPSLADTPGDTRVYVLEGAQRGGAAVVVGGTHGNEIAGIMTATLLVERARVATGRLIVIPNANNSAVSAGDPERPGPEWIEVKTSGGTRRFKYGARRTRPEHQGAPDPARYRHPSSTEEIEGREARNLDRVYPGDPSGTLTERVAAAILRVLVQEKADLAFDLHEAGPESRLAWTIVANPKNVEMGALAVLRLDEAGIPMKLEPSSEGFRGLSHREWGDATPARAFLFETPNPGQVEQPGGADVVDHPDFPLTRRVGVHLAALQAVLDVHDADAPAASRVELSDLPSLAELMRLGLGAFLQPAAPVPPPSPPPRGGAGERMPGRALPRAGSHQAGRP